jgi:hypothetical protein
MFLKKLFTRKKSSPQKSKWDRGIMIFDHTSEVIRAEKTLKDAGWSVKVMGPPAEIQKGCDLVIEFPLMEQMNILRTLEQEDTSPLTVVPVTSPLLSPVELFQTKDFGEFLMVRAANMKMTIRKQDLTIVNISGGGCPDVPYLAAQLTGQKLFASVAPRDIGHTLCGYALQLAYEELSRQCLS